MPQTLCASLLSWSDAEKYIGVQGSLAPNVLQRITAPPLYVSMTIGLMPATLSQTLSAKIDPSHVYPPNGCLQGSLPVRIHACRKLDPDDVALSLILSPRSASSIRPCNRLMFSLLALVADSHQGCEALVQYPEHPSTSGTSCRLTAAGLRTPKLANGGTANTFRVPHVQRPLRH